MQVTFTGIIDTSEINSLAEYESYVQEIFSNGEVQSTDYGTPKQGVTYLHDGVPNDASYYIIGHSNNRYDDKDSNTVTVTPPTTEVHVDKTWIRNVDDEEITLKWPADLNEQGDLVEQKITFNLCREDAVNPIASIVLPLEESQVPAGSTKYEYTFTGLPKYNKTDSEGNVTVARYYIEEVSVDGYDTTGSGYDNIQDPVENSYNYSVKNELTEYPRIEKYVDKDVHSELTGFNKEFEYDILAYITKDAVRTVITDELVPGVKFEKDENTTVTVTNLGPDESDHTAYGTVSKPSTDNLGSAAAINVDPENKTLTVTIENSKPWRGCWIRVNYKAVLDNDKVNNLESYLKAENGFGDGDDATSAGYSVVGSEAYAEGHKGIKNTASYTIVPNNRPDIENYPYEAESNTVTVTPPVTNVKVKKDWTRTKEHTINPNWNYQTHWPVIPDPDDPENEIKVPVTFTLYRGTREAGADPYEINTGYTVKLPINNDVEEYTFVGLPVYVYKKGNKEYTYKYSVKESNVPAGYETTIIPEDEDETGQTSAN